MTTESEGGWHSGSAPGEHFQDFAGRPELMAALDWLPVATLILAADGSAVAVNRAWVTLSAAARSDSRGDGWLNAVDPADRTTLRARLRGAASAGETGGAEFRLASPAARGWSRWWWRPGPAGRLIVCATLTGDRQHSGDDQRPETVRGPRPRLAANPPLGRDDQRAQPDYHPAQQAPRARPDHNPDVVSLLDSVVRRAFQAGLALQDIPPGSPQATAAIDRALGQLEAIVREARDLAFQLRSTGIGMRPRPGRR